VGFIPWIALCAEKNDRCNGTTFHRATMSDSVSV
jgi:hypothetical protein